mgnify:CR=1 FL=1
MTFGIKRKIRKQLFGVKKGVHRASKFGSKSLDIGALLFPEALPEIGLAKLALDEVATLTKGKGKKNKPVTATSFVDNVDTDRINARNEKNNIDILAKNNNVSGF